MIADGVSLASVAVRLGALVDRDVAVQAEVADVPVTLRAVAVSADVAIDELSSRVVEVLNRRSGSQPPADRTIAFVRRDPARWRTQREHMMLLYDVRSDLARGVAEATCGVGRPGMHRASALEAGVLITALPEDHRELRMLLEFVSEHAGDGTRGFTCQRLRPRTSALPTTKDVGELAIVTTPGGVSVRAEKVPLHRLVMELAAALGVNAQVAPTVADVSMSLGMKNVSLETFSDELERLGLEVSRLPFWSVVGQRSRKEKERVVGAAVLETPDVARALAESLCGRPGGEVDAASAVGNVVLFRGTHTSVERAARISSGRPFLVPQREGVDAPEP